MQMIRAIIRPEKVDDVIIALDDEQFHSVTVMDAEGRGIQKGLNKGDEHFDQLPKKLLILVVINLLVLILVKIPIWYGLRFLIII